MLCLSMTAIIFIAWVGARQVFEGSMTVGELSAFLFYAVMAGGSIATISEVIGEVQRGVGASERLYQLYYTQPDIISVDSTDAQPGIHDATRTSNAPTITLEKISFSYSNQAPLFDQLSLHINARETLALVGPSWP